MGKLVLVFALYTVVALLFICNTIFFLLLARAKNRIAALNIMNKRLEKNDRMKSEYVLRVSHDIKEGLATIQGCLEPVARGITGELNPKQLDLVQRAVNRTSRLMLFVKALLEITRIKLSREIKMDYFSFKDILFEAVSNIDSKAKDKGISINAKVEPSIDRMRCSKEYIQETLTNLLANSVKYTHRNGKIDIGAKDKGNRILINISDNGIGIPKDELPRIFEEFYRAANAKGVEKDGTGLGLSIAKRIVEMHNGKIWAESQEGKGTVFHIELPK